MDDSGGSQPYQRVDRLAWTEVEKLHGKVIKLKGFPSNHKVKLFRVVLSACGEAHGLCCDQRHGARRHAGCTCAILDWVRLKQVANETKKTVYHLKHDLLSDHLRLQLKSPAIQMTFA